MRLPSRGRRIIATMTAPPTIWIVDDDDSVRRSLIRLIRSAGIHVRGFASARAFLDASPDGDGCLLLDLQIPPDFGMTASFDLDLAPALRAPGV